MYIDDCIDCKIITGPIDSSIFIRTCKNCTVSTIARQVRFRDSENIKMFTYCPSDPAVESSFNISFAPYNAFFPHLQELFKKGKFIESEQNHIKTPYDFTSDKVFGNGAKHFFQMPEEEFYIEEIKDGDFPCEEMFENYSKQEPFINNQLCKKRKNQQSQMKIDLVDNVIPFNDANLVNIDNIETNFKPFSVENNKSNEDLEFSNHLPPFIHENNDINVEENNRQLQRQKEIEERGKNIKEKIEYELNMKKQNRQKATEYINAFNTANSKKIADNQKNNQFLETKRLKEKEKRYHEKDFYNSWEKINKMIDLKDSDYKGSKNVLRMRTCLINQINDYNIKSNFKQ